MSKTAYRWCGVVVVVLLAGCGREPDAWLTVTDDVAAFQRGGAQCWVNTGTAAVALPEVATVVLASVPGVGPELPPDAAVWLKTGESPG